ncbi:MAG: hypothetical protein OXB88_11050 [Bacteriovoracales bacterium]|nr:hypothetical protein [Bacteriovoracales bacterium]
MKNELICLFILTITLSIWPPDGRALPIDWNGTFSVDTTVVGTYTRTDENTGAAQIDGSQEIPGVPGGANTASFQTHTFKLRPTIIINDAASLFGEITTGHSSGGYFGQGLERAGSGDGSSGMRGLGNALYNYTSYRDAAHFRYLYTKYYADTTTYIIGRQPFHWALGAIFNDGQGRMDRFATIEDGIMAHFNVGNFRFSPYYMQASGDTLDDDGQMKSTGVQALYQSSERDLALGLLFGKRKSSPLGGRFKTAWQTSSNEPGALGSTDVRVLDFYFQKSIDRLQFQLEIPIIDGDLGQVYGAGESNTYDAKAFIGKASYELNHSWNIALDMGHISGDRGRQTQAFEALYLHPNYQVAHLMFRYNMHAVRDKKKEENIFDSYMTNMNFAKILASYKADKWVFNMGLIWASAIETARSGQEAFHHERNTPFSAGGDQSNDYGFELDLDFEYKWNSNISLLGSMGYHFVGDYYAYRPSGTPISLQNSYAVQLKTLILF